MSKTRKNRKNVDKYKLELLFDNVLEKAYKLNKSRKNFDGLGFWQPIKKMLEPLDRYNAKKWKKISKTKTRKIMLLPEYTINGYDEKTTNRVHHFIIQQVRIPINEKPTIKKIIQVALNIGQYKGTNDGNFIYNIKFNDISQFIYKTDIIELSKHISDETMEKINEYLSSV